MVSVRRALDSASRACGRTVYFSVFQRFAQFPSCRNLCGFPALSVVLSIVLGAMFLTPFFASLSSPSAMLIAVLFNVLAIAFVYFLFVTLAVLAISLKIFRKMCAAIGFVVFPSNFRVFEWHTSYFGMTGRTV